jgi:hypothetical protein
MLHKKSEELINYFTKTKCLYKYPFNQLTKQLFLSFYDKLIEAEEFVNNIQSSLSPQIKKINNIRDIPKSRYFKFVPLDISKHIEEKSIYSITYNFSLLERKFIIHFIIEENNPIHIFHSYLCKMMMWLYILQKNISNNCSKTLTIYLYFTKLEKQLPNNSNLILDITNVNTAFTFSCRYNNEIVIFRKEEWFKVFIHETFHSFGLDFSKMDITFSSMKILEFFNVVSEVNLFEAYTEIWARIIHSMFISYFLSKREKKKYITFLSLIIYLEQIYSIFQMNKVLKYMNMDYKEIIYNPNKNIHLKYKEKTNVLSYYVITCNLLVYYQEFIKWCKINNKGSFFPFLQTNENQMSLCNFIKEHYKRKDYLKLIECVEKLIKEREHNIFLKNNLRMTIIELQ